MPKWKRSAGTAPDGDFLERVRDLARAGLNQKQIAAKLGIKTTATLMARLIRASQESRRPVPMIGRGGRGRVGPTRVESVEVRGRSGGAFAVNIPEEPLRRAGVKMGDSLTVNVSRRRIVLALESKEKAAEAGPRKPRLIKGRK